MKKKLIPCIYLKNEKAVAFFSDNTIVDSDPLELCRRFCDNGADELLIFDLSKGDEEHEKALSVIKNICAHVQVPVTGAGNVERMEDIKKLLYAGCKRAVLNYSKPSNVELTKEVSDKFGKSKIVASVKNINELEDNIELIRQYTKTVLLHDITMTKSSVFDEGGLKYIAMLKAASLDKIIDYLKQKNAEGITGEVVNENYKDYVHIKEIVGEEYVPFSSFKLDDKGLIPVVVQDYKTNRVLMLAYMNEEAYDKTLSTGTMTYFSRSRQSLWVKGETSGHFQYVKALSYDCDADTLLARVEQIGNACHTGEYSCFFNDIITYDFEEKNPLEVLNSVYSIIEDRKVHPKEGSYTNYLFDKGIDKILKKLGEEATEIVIAAKNPGDSEVKYEISDFLYHCMVLMVQKGVTWEDIMTELANR
ncbi:MAG: bifunctional phosphoribosyl-AMP cyclohydrolase/phosphoribosyl-ATP diphosphatase HisIE [Lachnospiraceae bacterium]|nr:bifunctional phosphoribosyl-AMP cyclohydrolase/phosphoribosyl-ATP diphosphatase HisIE [Lachnospiraceae bacterium]